MVPRLVVAWGVQGALGNQGPGTYGQGLLHNSCGVLMTKRSLTKDGLVLVNGAGFALSAVFVGFLFT